MKTFLFTEGETVHSTDYVDYDISVKLTLIFAAVGIYIIIRVWLSIRKDKRKNKDRFSN